MIYKWKDSTSEFYQNFDAQVVGEHLEIVSAKHGELSPDAIVAAAENVESPLHELFEWDDAIAARGFRFLQAEEVAGSLITVKLENGKTEEETPRFMRVIARPHESRNMSDAVCSTASRRTVDNLNSAIFELKGWYERFENVKGLSKLLSTLRAHWPDCGIEAPKERFAVRASSMVPVRKPILNWCAVCMQDNMRIQAIREVSGVPLCKPCVELYADEPSVLKDASAFMSTLETA